ncbi:hypothetical protein [Anatilimnocola floriformis]|uniref:hypothetical protein n=1 Tax=Anatilimnocola floriformis TaxID=2948575 RepID=UPI0020C5945D|nr:hypothetical protein [Anatilimnocola floriformis]
MVANAAQAQFRDTFESTQPAWTLAAADAGVKVLAQDRTFKESRSGSGSEYLRLMVGNGTFVHLTYSPGKAPVIAELEPSLWVKADKANLQLMVRVVLPRTTDRGTGKPLTTLLSGDTYSDVGRWQQLHVKEILRRLDGPELIRLRREFGPAVDVRGAQIDLLVINAYSNPGNLQLWIDDVEIKGFVNQDNTAMNAARPLVNSLNDDPNAPSPSSPAHGAEVQGSMLMVHGRPFMPRIIQHQGEPLAWLQSLGFNAVKFNSSPSPALLKEAQRLGLWIVAPPPFADATAPPPEVFQSVLGWSLGNHLVDRDVPFTRDLASEVRSIDPQRQRPLVAGADCELAEYSRLATLLLLDRRTNATSCELGEQRDWLKDRQKIARPGTPCWGVVHSQPSPALDQQLALFGRDSTHPNDTDLEQLRLAMYTNLAAGMRGILFPSETALSIDSVPAAMRTDALRLLNYELRLVEPWISGGQLSDELSSPESGVHAAVWQTERSRLMLITQRAASQQYVTPPAPRNQFTLLIPGVPAGSYAYQVSTAGLRQLRSSLATGGLRIIVDEATTASLVVVTHDPLVIHFLNRTITEIKSDSTRLRHDLAVRRQSQITDVDQRLSTAGHPLKESASWLRDAESNLAQAQRMLSTGDFPAALGFVVKAEQLQARLRRGHWEQTAVGFHAPAASPCVAQFTTLPLHWQLADKLRGATWSANAQGAGDFESLDVMTKVGWKNYDRVPDDIKTEVSLSLVNPHSGRSALRLAAAPRDVRKMPGPLERPLVWITSSPVPVREKQIARITGWAYVPQQIVGSHDGLMIFDSLGGPDLADRMRLTRGWRQFTIYRAVPESGDLVLTFALTGLGEAWIDDVQVNLLDPDPIREVARGN